MKACGAVVLSPRALFFILPSACTADSNDQLIIKLQVVFMYSFVMLFLI
jgi:hypothetical protein